MLEELIRYDKELFLYLNQLGSSNWDQFWLFMTHKWNSLVLYAVLLLMAIRQLGIKQTLWMLIFIGFMILASDQLSNFFKYGFKRLRPCYDPEVNTIMRLVKNSCGGKYGFFSSHASNSFALATFFMKLLEPKKYWFPILLLWAILVSYSRIYIGVHFPLDVLTGALIGLFFGTLFYRLFTKAMLKIQT